MAPLPISEVQPQIVRREPDQIALPVIHSSATSTTIIPSEDSTAIAIGASIAIITTVPSTKSTQAARKFLPRDTSSGSSNTGVVVGAVLGSILGTLVLLVVLYKCCFDNRSAAWIPTVPRSYASDSDSERSSRSSRVHRRGGGGKGFGRNNRHGDRVRRPRRARTRRTHGEESASPSERSYGSRYERRIRRSNGMSNNDGLLGWFLLPRSASHGHRYSEKRHRRSSWTGGGDRGLVDD